MKSMMNIKKLLVVGGDKRQLYMAQSLMKRGFDVELYGFIPLDGFEHMSCVRDESLETAAQNANAIILPLPVSRDGITVNTQGGGRAATLEELSDILERGQTVFAGMMSNSWKSNFFKKGIRVFDYFEREELAVNNAIPTAQGVIKIAIDNLEITLHGSHCAVTGFGRTAKILAEMLSAMGAHVTVAARKCSDLAWARSAGYEGVHFGELAECADKFDVLVNTVPTLVVDEKILSNLRSDCLIIEIASAPYGIDFARAKELGLKVIVTGSLPGKTAPKTAGEIIGDAISNIIKEGS